MSRVKLVVVGDANVGKTSLLTRYTTKKFPQSYEPTVFEDHEAYHMVDGNRVTLTLCDTAGEEAYKNLRIGSYTHADVFLVCFAVNHPESLKNVTTTWAPEVKDIIGDSTKIVLVGLKSDMRETLPSSELVPQSRAKGVSKEINATHYLECSSLKEINVDKVFEQAIRVGMSDFKIPIIKKKSRPCLIL